MDAGTIAVLLRLQDELSGPARQAQQSVRGISKTLQDAGKAATDAGRKLSIGVTAPILALGTAIARTGMSFDAEMQKIVGLVGVSQDQVNDWKSELLDLGVALGIAPQQLAEGLFFVTSAGFRGAEALDVLTQAGRASAAGLGDVMSIADLVTSAINAYGVENMDASRATDILTAAVREGKLEASSLAPVMGSLLPTASALRISFEDVAGMMAVFSRTGSNAAESATSINAIMSTLLKPTDAARELLAGVGLSAGDLRDVVGQPGGLLTVMRLLDETFGDNDEALSQIFPNVRAFRGVMNALAQDGETVDSVMAGVAESTGSLDHAFDSISPSALAWRRTMAGIKALLAELSVTVLPPVTRGLGILLSGLNAMRDAIRNLSPQTRQFVATFLGMVAAIGPLLLTLGKLVSVIVFLASPIGLVVAGLVLLSGAFSAAHTWSERFQDVLQRGLSYAFVLVRDALLTFIQALQGDWQSGEGIRPLHDAVGRFGLLLRETIIPAIVAVGSWFLNTGIPAFLSLAGVVKDRVIPAVIEFGAWLIDRLMPVFSAAIDIVRAVADGFGEGGLAGAVSRGAEALGVFLAAMGTFLGELLSAAAAKLLELGQMFVDWISPYIGPALDKLAEWGQAIGAWILTTGLPLLAAQLQQWGAALVAWIGPQIPPLLAQLGELANRARDWILGEGLSQLTSALRGWASAFVAWLGPQLTLLIAEAEALASRFGAWITGDGLSSLVARLAAWTGAFVEWIWPVWLRLQNEALSLLGDLLAWIVTDALPKIVTQLAEWTLAFHTWVLQDALPALMADLGGLLGDLLGWVTDTALPDIVERIKGWARAFLDWIKDSVLPFLPAKLGEMLSSIAGWVADTGVPAALAEAAALGRALLDGIVAGIKSAPGLIGDALWSVVSDGKSWVMGKLGIESPSKVFRDEIGLPIGWGIAQGINWARPEIRAMLLAVADDVLSTAESFIESGQAIGRQLIEAVLEAAERVVPESIAGFERIFTRLGGDIRRIADDSLALGLVESMENAQRLMRAAMELGMDDLAEHYRDEFEKFRREAELLAAIAGTSVMQQWIESLKESGAELVDTAADIGMAAAEALNDAVNNYVYTGPGAWFVSNPGFSDLLTLPDTTDTATAGIYTGTSTGPAVAGTGMLERDRQPINVSVVIDGRTLARSWGQSVAAGQDLTVRLTPS